MTTAIYPGSFDPVTNGHLDIIIRASSIFDSLIVAVLHNRRKDRQGVFSVPERVRLLERVTQDLPNVEIDASELLLARYAVQKGATVVVKGLRAVSDFENEFQMALTNRKLNPELDTMFLMSSFQYLYLSSSIVREVGTLGGDIADFVPDVIYRDVLEKLRQ